VEKTLKKPSEPLVFSKTVATSYLAPEAPSGRRTKARRGGQPGRPSGSRLLMPVDAVAEDLTRVVAHRSWSEPTASQSGS
jgi:hypothetical protein